MSEQSQFFPRAGNRREPGADPVPTKRQSTPASTPTPAEKTPTSTPQRRGRCGSGKPREKFRKELINLIFQEGLLEVSEREPDQEQAVEQKGAVSRKSSTHVIWTVDESGGMIAKNPDGSTCEEEERAPASSSPLQEVVARRAIEEALCKTQLKVNLEELVKAALKNKKLRDQLLNAPSPRQPRKKSEKTSPEKIMAAAKAPVKSAAKGVRGTIQSGIKPRMNRGLRISTSGQVAKPKKKGTTVH
ncbi:MAG: hypothetical protein ACRCZE_02835 [Candidatus Altimarinota bacterium]